MSRIRSACTLIAIGSLAWGCWFSPRPAAACAGDTPEKTFEHASAFMATGDPGGMAACLTPEGRKEAMFQMLADVMMMVGMASRPEGEARDGKRVEGEAMVQSLTDILVAHGLSEEAAEKRDKAAIETQLDGVDHAALVADLADLMKSLDPSNPGLQSYDIGELTDLVVDGDSARGTAGGQPMVFTRVDGLWYLVP
jgi:hypothetical protein